MRHPIEIATATLHHAARYINIVPREVFDTSMKAAQRDDWWSNFEFCELTDVTCCTHSGFNVLILLELGLAMKLLLKIGHQRRSYVVPNSI